MNRLFGVVRFAGGIPPALLVIRASATLCKTAFKKLLVFDDFGPAASAPAFDLDFDLWLSPGKATRKPNRGAGRIFFLLKCKPER